MSRDAVGGAFHPASASDYVPLAQMRQLQLQRLRAVVRRAYDRVELFRQRLDERAFPPDLAGENTLGSKKCLNVALAGALSVFLDLPQEQWLAAIRANLPEKVHAMNLDAFQKGRQAAARLRR